MITGFLDLKKSFYIGAILAGALVVLLAIKYQSDVRKFGTVGVGLWLLLLSGLVSVAGGITGLRAKKAVTR